MGVSNLGGGPLDLSRLKTASTDLPKFITNCIDICLDETIADYDIRMFLKNHERRPLFESNMLRELRNDKHVGLRLDRSRLIVAISGMLALFVQGALNAAEAKARGKHIESGDITDADIDS